MVRRTLIVLGGVALAGSLLGAPLTLVIRPADMERLWEMEREVLRIEGENRRLAAEVEELRRFIRDFRSEPRFREKVVRDELGYVSTGEVVYRLREPEPRRGGDR